jgi:uncharacterized protein YkwD
MTRRSHYRVVAVLLGLACQGDTLYDVSAGENPIPSGSNRAPVGQFFVEPEGVMAPVQARVRLTCTDPDGDSVTHLLSYTGSTSTDVQSADAVDLIRSFLRSAEIRGWCRDSRGLASRPIIRQLNVVNGEVQRDSVLLLSNAARANAGVPAVAMDSRLTALAEAHARDMAERGYFSHTTPEGKTFGERLREAGITGAAGENLAGNSTAAGAVQAWLNSAGHRANMLNGTFRRLGVGVYRTLQSPYTYYVQVFTN